MFIVYFYILIRNGINEQIFTLKISGIFSRYHRYFCLMVLWMSVNVYFDRNERPVFVLAVCLIRKPFKFIKILIKSGSNPI